MSVSDVAASVRRRSVSAVEIVGDALGRIRRLDPALNAFTVVLEGDALAAARQVDAALDRGKAAGPLAGVPVAVKDIIDVAGVPTACGSTILKDQAAHDAPVVASLRAAGAIIVGKTNLHEFAYGVTTINPHTGTTRNPWDLTRIAGGSSGGSAAAVAAGLCCAALGTDTGGSVRIPSALCGIVGFKPTYGSVSCRGVVPLAWSLDHVGPMTRTVADAAVMYAAMNPGRAYEAPTVPGSVTGTRVGLIRPWFEAAAPEVAGRVADAVSVLAGAGAEVTDIDIAHLETWRTAFAMIQLPEASAFHLPWLRTRAGDYGLDVRQRLLAGALLPATAYLAGQRGRTRLRDALCEMFARVDVLVAPTVLVPACPISTETVRVGFKDMDVRTAFMGFNPVISLAGAPAISVPCGFVAGLPVGMEIIGRRFEDARVLEVAAAYEARTPWSTHRPPDPRPD
jgi:aspartyl-tRNA(Asn)/glutamyl-tRNA(Gln) amidotransferase subunit A